MNICSIYEFDALVSNAGGNQTSDIQTVPDGVFQWLEQRCLRMASEGGAAWLRLGQRMGRRAIQVTNYVGVIQAPNGFQIEVLPKVAQAIGGGANEARKLLIAMLRCLKTFRHVRTERAQLRADQMPLLEIFIAEFLSAVQSVVKQGLCCHYVPIQENVFALKGKILMATHLRQNICRADRLFAEHDEFSANRPENRLLHAALCQVLTMSSCRANQQLGRELRFVFADIPMSTEIAVDFQRSHIDRSMGHYCDALDWARLILQDESPVTGAGLNRAPSLLFPMEAVFEAYVAKHLATQLVQPFMLKNQARTHYLVKHNEERWFQLKPDLLIRRIGEQGPIDLTVLDTKWKILESNRANRSDKYGLSQSDIYQMLAYGQNYLRDGKGDLVLIYPKTDKFSEPLPVFEFPKQPSLRLWVLPFCLRTRELKIPVQAPFYSHFKGAARAAA